MDNIATMVGSRVNSDIDHRAKRRDFDSRVVEWVAERDSSSVGVAGEVGCNCTSAASVADNAGNLYRLVIDRAAEDCRDS